jgi:Endonuclease-reverse transcriptase
MTHVICGDWNARVGNLSPTINNVQVQRKSDDPTTNGRAPWLIERCELQGWKILNGQQPGMPARHTFSRENVKSCVDLILSNTSTSDVEYDPDTLHGLSDHILVMTKIHTSHFHRVKEKQLTGTK